MDSRLEWLMTACIWASAGSARNSPQRFLTGEVASATINLETAERIAEACQRIATGEEARHSIMILDREGTPVYMDRMDGHGYLNTVTAEMKARTALITGQPSKLSMNRAINDPMLEFEQMLLGV